MMDSQTRILSRRMGSTLLYSYLSQSSIITTRVSQAIFLKTMKQTHATLVVVLLERTKGEEPILQAVQPLLKEFQDVMIDSLLTSLPPPGTYNTSWILFNNLSFPTDLPIEVTNIA